ncbi:hypothetical protein IMZ48_09995, partial [Candidatus Bathyarchaeota archaeon]|nr:hypothetical protein [Candidatus Bathyarchaeota archaeon]
TNPPTLLTREEFPNPSHKPDGTKATPLPTLNSNTTLAIILSISGTLTAILLLTWYLRRRSKRRATTTRSGRAKWEPGAGLKLSPSRSWVDANMSEDVERQRDELRRGQQRVREMGFGGVGGQRLVWGAPKWSAVAERMAQHEREVRNLRAAERRGPPGVSEVPPAVIRRPTGDRGGHGGTSGGESYVAMLWAPGQRPAPARREDVR